MKLGGSPSGYFEGPSLLCLPRLLSSPKYRVLSFWLLEPHKWYHSEVMAHRVRPRQGRGLVNGLLATQAQGLLQVAFWRSKRYSCSSPYPEEAPLSPTGMRDRGPRLPFLVSQKLQRVTVRTLWSSNLPRDVNFISSHLCSPAEITSKPLKGKQIPHDHFWGLQESERTGVNASFTADLGEGGEEPWEAAWVVEALRRRAELRPGFGACFKK